VFEIFLQHDGRDGSTHTTRGSSGDDLYGHVVRRNGFSLCSSFVPLIEGFGEEIENSRRRGASGNRPSHIDANFEGCHAIDSSERLRVPLALILIWHRLGSPAPERATRPSLFFEIVAASGCQVSRRSVAAQSAVPLEPEGRAFAQEIGNGEGMSDELVLSESMQLRVAGHETSSNALSWLVYLLSSRPDCREGLRQEFDSVLGDGPLSYSDVPKFQFATQVIQEALRLYPPFWMVDRMALSDDRVGDLVIPRGSTVVVFVYGVRHSHRHWENPEHFDPERFSKANEKLHTPSTWLPPGRTTGTGASSKNNCSGPPRP
jgi:hypothetical protein